MRTVVLLALLLTMTSVGVISAEDQPKQPVRAKGTLEPEDVIDVGAQVSGQVLKVSVDFGNRVQAGDVLAQLDDSLYRCRVEKAQAQVQLAKATLKVRAAELAQAIKASERARALLEKAAISRDDYEAMLHAADVATAQIDVAKASIAQAEAELKEAKINLDYTAIHAPVAGVILDRRVNPGQSVTASLNAPSLFLIAKDPKRLQVWASVPETDIAKIVEGQAVTFTCDAFPNKTFEGKVTQVRLNAARKKNVVLYTVVVAVDNADGKLLPYLTADVTFKTAKPKGDK